MVKKILKYFAFALFLLFIAIFAFVINFPVGRLLDKYLTDINKDIGEYQISFKDAEMGILGLTVNQIKIQSQDEKIDVVLTRADVPIIHYSLFLGIIPATLNLYRGDIDIKYGFLSDNADFVINKVRFSDIPMIADTLLLNNSPDIFAVGNYNVANNNYKLNFKTGNVLLNGENNLVPIEFRSFIPKNINFSGITGQLNSEGGRLAVNVETKGNFNGKINGTVLLQGNTPQLNINITGEFDQNFQENNKSVYDIVNMAYMNGNTLSINISGNAPNINVTKQ